MKKTILTALFLAISASVFAKVIVSAETAVAAYEWDSMYSMNIEAVITEGKDQVSYNEKGYAWTHSSEMSVLQNSILSVCYEFPGESDIKAFAGINAGISPWNFTAMAGVTGGFSLPLFATKLYQFELQGKASLDYVGDVSVKGYFIQPGVNIILKDVESDGWFLSSGIAANNTMIWSKEEVNQKTYEIKKIITGVCMNIGIGFKF